jgi:hypothetical protein
MVVPDVELDQEYVNGAVPPETMDAIAEPLDWLHVAGVTETVDVNELLTVTVTIPVAGQPLESVTVNV